MTDIGSLGGTYLGVKAIKDRGQVVGCSETTTTEVVHAFVWEDGILTDLGTLGGDTSSAVAINNRGQIVGLSTIAPNNYDYHAVLWER
jgi:probable HAF family extracellular repeat protein